MTLNAWLLISLIIFGVTTVATAGYAIVFRKASALDPILQFVFLYALVVLPLPIRAYTTTVIDGDVTEHLTGILRYMPIAVFLSALGLPFFTYGYYSNLACHIGLRLPTPTTGNSPGIAFLGLSGLSFFLLGLLTRSSGGLINLILLGYGSSAEIFGKGYLAVGFPWLSVASMFLLWRYAVRRTLINLLLFGTVLFVVGSINLIMGNRSQLMFMGLAVLIFWHNAIRPISIKALATVGLVGFLALNLVGSLRGSNFESLSDFWSRTTEPNKASLENSDSLFYTLTTGEFVVPFETLPQMIKSVGQEVNPQLGLTYLKAPLFFVPSVIFPHRPNDLAHWYMIKFYGDTYGLNEGRAFFFLSEGYLNFGPIGVIGTMFIWGLFLGAAHSYVRRAKRDPAAILLYALSVAFIFRGIVGDSVSLFVGLPEQALSAAILGIWMSNWGRGRKAEQKSFAGVASRGRLPV
jgi:hypothetical protein